MKRLRRVLLVVAVVALVLAIQAPGAEAQAPITLKAVTGWTKGWVFNDMFFEWVNLVNERAGGRLKIEYRGGPEVFPAFEQLDPLKRGVIEIINTAGGYVAGALPEFNATLLLFDAADPAKAREIGLFERLDRIAREKAGVTVLGATMWLPFTVFLTKPVEKADLRGLKIRSTAAYEPVLKGVGAATVSMPPAEILMALQTGTVDGFAWPSNFVVGPGFARLIKYKVMPWWWQSTEGVVVLNARAFDSLPADLKRVLVDAMKEVERKAKSYYLGKERAEDEELKRLGVKTITLPAAEISKVYRIQWEEGTKAFLTGPSPKYGQELKELMAPFAPR
jgi:TRAP-type C4-dicarboxylate transport system substrate-binding protein